MFSIIVAADINNGIGKNGKLPWNIPDDLRIFRTITTNSTVIMGRKTWESLPVKPLKNRHNIVISNTLDLLDGAVVCKDLEKALQISDSSNDIFIIGGSKLYNEGMSHYKCRDIILTRIYKDFECDTFINKFPLDFIHIYSSDIKSIDDLKYVNQIWTKVT